MKSLPKGPVWDIPYSQMSEASRETKIDPRSLSYHVEQALEGRMLSGEWPEGFRLPSEGQLCKDFGVSRTAIREALRELRGRGLIKTVNGSGSYVTGARFESVSRAMATYSRMANQNHTTDDLVDFRTILEGEAASRLALNPDKELGVNALQGIIEKMDRAPTADDFGAMDLEFHLCLLSTFQNTFISMMAEALYVHYEKFIKESHRLATENMRHLTLEEHQAIVDAIRQGDAAKARAALKTHLQVAAKRWQELDQSSN